MNRRIFLKAAAAAAASAAVPGAEGQESAYTYRIAFGAWINDMRLEPLPLENWPAPQFDEVTMESLTHAMTLQALAGFNLLDAWGLFATYGWPVDIASAIDGDRRRLAGRLIEAARARGIRLVYGLGTYSWGYDTIIAADPAVRGKDGQGNPHPHAMCGANPKSFEYVKKILDLVLSEFDFAGVHLESCDLGCCMCPECAGKDGVTAYNVRINMRTADYIRSRWPGKFIYVIPINWIPFGKRFNDDEKSRIVELSAHVDCFMDQGWAGSMVAPEERPAFIRSLRCTYGTSGGIWLYPDARWDRTAYFLPYARRTGNAIREHFAEGARACMFYQGPVNNPGTEVTIAAGGRILRDVRRAPEDALAEVLELIYKPRKPASLRRLVDLFLKAEDAYFGQWSEKRVQDAWKTPLPGEFKLDQHLFGTTPGPATFLCEPLLDTAGRAAYKKGLVSILKELREIAGDFEDFGRIHRIEKGIASTLMLINTIAYAKGEGGVLG